jgi:hypothetical protein
VVGEGERCEGQVGVGGGEGGLCGHWGWIGIGMGFVGLGIREEVDQSCLSGVFVHRVWSELLVDGEQPGGGYLGLP